MKENEIECWFFPSTSLVWSYCGYRTSCRHVGAHRSCISCIWNCRLVSFVIDWELSAVLPMQCAAMVGLVQFQMRSTWLIVATTSCNLKSAVFPIWAPALHCVLCCRQMPLHDHLGYTHHCLHSNLRDGVRKFPLSDQPHQMGWLRWFVFFETAHIMIIYHQKLIFDTENLDIFG